MRKELRWRLMFWAFSPILSVDPEKLRRLLDDEPTFSQTIDNLAERQDGMDPVDQLPTESLDTAELIGMLASPVRSPEDEVNPAGSIPAGRGADWLIAH
ncbi:hypothetical protein AS156_36355 [Bradyrhizobium macuxiense]|uniref:Uncharacterized protein n=1 Tax=Bradyrhizobium macuxiense TaxID=1755647 RepID=A0A109JZZ6_9BRAD|nr:hypothetical protein AS156_36355 [Bradyrhizobium macuxiense]